MHSSIENIKKATTGGGSGSHTPPDSIKSSYDSVSMNSESQLVDIQRTGKEHTPRASTPNFLLDNANLNHFGIFDVGTIDIETENYCFLQRSELKATASGTSSEDVSLRGDAAEPYKSRQGDRLLSSSPTPSTTTMTSETAPNIPDLESLGNQV